MPENVSLVVAGRTAISDSRRNDSRYRLAIFGDRILETPSLVSCPLPISVAAWFDARGFGLVLSQEGAVWWARLTPKATPESVIDRYGKGDTPVAAAQRARERYEHEQ
jgi:hypothetical protein